MKIKKLQTADFRGLPGVRTYDFDGINAFIGANATGKTSVLSALRYVLTGEEPQGEIVTAGASRTAVQATFEDGSSVSRIKYAQKGKAQKYYVNGKRGTLGEVNTALRAQMGGRETGDTKIIASSELLRGLNAKAFGSLLLSYVPEMMTAQDVVSRITDIEQQEKDMILAALPEGEFGIEALDELYASFVEKRKAAKKKITEEKAVISSYDAFEPPKETVEELEKMLDDLTKRRDAAITAAAKKQEVERAQKRVKDYGALIENIDKKMAEIVVVNHREGEKKEAEVLLDAYRTAATGAYAAMQAASVDGKALKKAIDTIGKPVCPLSEKLVCTTDKSRILGDLNESLDVCKKNFADQRRIWEESKKKATEVEEKVKKITADEAAVKRMAELTAQREELVRTMPVVPSMPEKVEDPTALDRAIKECNNRIRYCKEAERVANIRTRLAGNEKILAKYEMLADAFSQKGEVKRAVTAYYIDAFEAPCNEKAEKLFHGMNLRFVYENGVSILVDAKGTGNYLSFDSLSEGEKVCVVFLLMSMLSNISGFRVLVLDELSVLDEATLGRLIDVLKEHKDEYDTAVIACVEHEDSRRVLEEKGINVIAEC